MNNFKLIGLIIIILSSLSIGFRNLIIYSQQDLDLIISSPQKLNIGQSIPIYIKLQNLSDIDSITVRQPQMFMSLKINLFKNDKKIGRQSLRNIGGFLKDIRINPSGYFDITYDLMNEYVLGLSEGNYRLSFDYYPNFKGEKIISNEIFFTINSISNNELLAKQQYEIMKFSDCENPSKVLQLFKNNFPNSLYLDKMRITLGEKLFLSKKYDESITMLEEVENSKEASIPEKEDAWILEAYCHYEKGDIDNALTTLTKVTQRTFAKELYLKWSPERK